MAPRYSNGNGCTHKILIKNVAMLSLPSRELTHKSNPMQTVQRDTSNHSSLTPRRIPTILLETYIGPRRQNMDQYPSNMSYAETHYDRYRLHLTIRTEKKGPLPENVMESINSSIENFVRPLSISISTDHHRHRHRHRRVRLSSRLSWVREYRQHRLSNHDLYDGEYMFENRYVASCNLGVEFMKSRVRQMLTSLREYFINLLEGDFGKIRLSAHIDPPYNLWWNECGDDNIDETISFGQIFFFDNDLMEEEDDGEEEFNNSLITIEEEPIEDPIERVDAPLQEDRENLQISENTPLIADQALVVVTPDRIDNVETSSVLMNDRIRVLRSRRPPAPIHAPIPIRLPRKRRIVSVEARSLIQRLVNPAIKRTLVATPSN